MRTVAALLLTLFSMTEGVIHGGEVGLTWTEKRGKDWSELGVFGYGETGGCDVKVRKREGSGDVILHTPGSKEGIGFMFKQTATMEDPKADGLLIKICKGGDYDLKSSSEKVLELHAQPEDDKWDFVGTQTFEGSLGFWWLLIYECDGTEDSGSDGSATIREAHVLGGGGLSLPG
eukprot:TRINITY_DN31357_c0_g1_i1.p1 TRINITY_DN31357_c0_g1~~TRINITY_DN31357_c0_g1_i1.p1  ORF type:complete len:192 (+),score=42.30 TRINITY_DN31357_c0_g1_i1:54-578(+)